LIRNGDQISPLPHQNIGSQPIPFLAGKSFYS